MQASSGLLIDCALYPTSPVAFRFIRTQGGVTSFVGAGVGNLLGLWEGERLGAVGASDGS